MWDSFSFDGPFNFSKKYFGVIDTPDNSKEIEQLSKRIEELEKDLKTHISGKYGVLYVPTHEELIRITTEQIKDELKKINGNKILE